jgi:streptogrisin C
VYLTYAHRNRYSSPTNRLSATLAMVLSAVAMLPLAVTAAPPSLPGAGVKPLNPAMFRALQRDAGLTAAQAERMIRSEADTFARAENAEKIVGDGFAGTWVELNTDGSYRLIVASTNRNARMRAESLNAESRTMKYSLAQLESAKSKIQALVTNQKATDGIHSLYVDVKTNKLVIATTAKSRGITNVLVARSGINTDMVRITTSASPAHPVNIFGGNRYYFPITPTLDTYCSMGFAVYGPGGVPGFTTAGHCGAAGLPVKGMNGVPIGHVAASIYGGGDAAWIQVTNPGAWPIHGYIYNSWLGRFDPVYGSTKAPLNSYVCRSGGTTGYRCGNVTIVGWSTSTIDGRWINDLTQTSACAGGGDSGGPFITPGGFALGITSNINYALPSGGNCEGNNPNTGEGPRTSYYPIGKFFGFGLTLKTVYN